MIDAGQFRDDLYYRLNGFTLALPALRERNDLAFLIDNILRQEIIGKDHPPRLTREALAVLNAHHWPGNIRELRNVLQYAVAVCADGRTITCDDLPDQLQQPIHDAVNKQRSCRTNNPPPPAAQHLLQVLRQHQWNITLVAAKLGVARITVYRRMKKFGLVPPNRR